MLLVAEKVWKSGLNCLRQGEDLESARRELKSRKVATMVRSSGGRVSNKAISFFFLSENGASKVCPLTDFSLQGYVLGLSVDQISSIIRILTLF